ncbi:DUF4256 domain-containing protein [Roseibacillus persicicus]|uniref:DUF4256 domain-containing protein n=1 Tax=Roseibacillus persicicus TaxID=454148 RepID=UPI00398B7697
MKSSAGKKLTASDSQILFSVLRKRFEDNAGRHPDLPWGEVEARLEADADRLWSLAQMEATGGEPDVVGRDEETGACLFYDCSPQSPKERCRLCYDREALESRKSHKPVDSAVDFAAAMGVRLLTEKEYAHLQTLGEFDTKSSSWLETPPEMRVLGGALFGDRRFGRVFFYHNGAESYYSGRGFRACLKV